MGFIEPKDHDFLVIEKVVNEVASLPKKKAFFNLARLSELLLYPNLVDAVHFIKHNIPHAKVKIITNAISLRDNLSKLLIQVGLDQIMISLNGVDKNDYLRLNGVDQYDNVKRNPEGLIKNRANENTIHPTINTNFKMHEKNIRDVPHAHSHWGNILLKSDTISTSEILPLTEGGNISYFWNAARNKRYPCAHLWGEVKLDVNGNIYPCDGKVMDYKFRENSALFLGNINKVTIEDACLSKKVSRFREKHLQDNIVSLPTCEQCPVWSIFPNVWIKNRFLPFLHSNWL